MNSLINLVARTIVRGAVYRYVFSLPKRILIPCVIAAGIALVLLAR